MSNSAANANPTASAGHTAAPHVVFGVENDLHGHIGG
jgi:hypothetical protein